MLKTILYGTACLDGEQHQSSGIVLTVGEQSTSAAAAAGFGALGFDPNQDTGAAINALRAHGDYLGACQKIILAIPDSHADLEQALLWYFGAWRCYRAIIPRAYASLAQLQVAMGQSTVKTVIEVARAYPIEGVFELDEIPEPPPLRTYEPIGGRLGRLFRPFRGELVVVTGITGHGKSTWLNYVLVGLAKKHNLKVLMASMETPTKPWLRDALRRQVVNHFSAFEPGPNYPDGQVAHPNLKDEAWQDDWIKRHFLFIDRNVKPFSSALTVSWLLELADNARMRHGIDILVIDPWNKFEHARERGENETEYIGRMLNELTTWAKQTGTIVFVVAHPGKSVMQQNGRPRPPTVFDIAGSMNWGNMADHVVIVIRDKEAGDVCQVTIDKSKFRAAGREGSVQYQFNEKTDGFIEVGPAAEAN